MSAEMISVAEAADRLGVHRTRVNQMIDDGLLPATRVGRSYIIRASDLDSVRSRPTPGRPKKQADEQPAKAKAVKKAGVKAAQKKGGAR
jgi:excisionase family DNA binding protein